MTNNEPLNTTTGRPRDDSRDTVIMAAVVDLVGRLGFVEVSIEAIALQAGVSKATIYRRWPGKAELVVATLYRHQQTVTDPAQTHSLRSDLIALILDGVEMLEMDGGFVAEVVAAMRTRPELREAVVNTSVAEFRRRFGVVVARARERDDVSPDLDEDLIAELIRSALLGRVAFDPRPIGAGFTERLVEKVLLPLMINGTKGTSR